MTPEQWARVFRAGFEEVASRWVEIPPVGAALRAMSEECDRLANEQEARDGQ